MQGGSCWPPPAWPLPVNDEKQQSSGWTRWTRIPLRPRQSPQQGVSLPGLSGRQLCRRQGEWTAEMLCKQDKCFTVLWCWGNKGQSVGGVLERALVGWVEDQRDLSKGLCQFWASYQPGCGLVASGWKRVLATCWLGWEARRAAKTVPRIGEILKLQTAD